MADRTEEKSIVQIAGQTAGLAVEHESDLLHNAALPASQTMKQLPGQVKKRAPKRTKMA